MSLQTSLIQTGTTQNFDEKVLNNQTLTLVDFWAEWCGPCKMIAPILDDVAKEFNDKINIVKINVDEEGELAAKYNVRSIPTLMIFKDGKAVDTKFGAVPKNTLIEWLKNHQ